MQKTIVQSPSALQIISQVQGLENVGGLYEQPALYGIQQMDLSSALLHTKIIQYYDSWGTYCRCKRYFSSRKGYSNGVNNWKVRIYFKSMATIIIIIIMGQEGKGYQQR